MNICDHLIKDQSILGISPLMLEFTSDFSLKALYETRRYFFSLHLAHNSILIHSDWFDIIGHGDEENKKARKDMAAFRTKYFKIREDIAQQIGELTASDIKSPLTDRAADQYETIKDQLNDLLTDLAPTEECSRPINDRVAQIYESIRSLRDLACTPVL